MKFRTIVSDRQEVARLDGEKQIVLYHDNSAKDRNLSFAANVSDAEGQTLSRTEKVQTVARRVANNYFSERTFDDHTGRPDVIVLEIIDEESDQHEYLIAEVKNSTNTDTIRRGIKEAVEYLAFLQVNEDFVFGSTGSDDYFGTGWNGLLVVQDLTEQTASVPEQESSEITILQDSELETQLEAVLHRVI